MTWSIICPSGDPLNLESALSSVSATHYNVDPQKFVAVIGFEPEALPPSLRGVRYVRQRKPFVYAQAINDGLAAVREDSVVLMNDDVTVTSRDTFDVLDLHASETSGSTILHPAVDGYTMRHEFMSVPSGSAPKTDCEEFPFICPFIPRRILEAVGRLDEEFIGYGKEDYDYCVRARSLGFTLSLIPRVRVFHNIRKSTYRRRKDIESLLGYNHDLLKKKWGIDSP